jgi:hypothetical protein
MKHHTTKPGPETPEERQRRLEKLGEILRQDEAEPGSYGHTPAEQRPAPARKYTQQKLW